MYVAEAEGIVFAELFEPTVGSLRIHRLPVPFYEQLIVIIPLSTELFGFRILFSLELLQHIHYHWWEFAHTL